MPNIITSYKKSLGRNYMIIDISDEDISDEDISINLFNNFRIHMLQENSIPGLLDTHIQYINELPSFQYDITGLQSLEVLMDTTPISHSILCKIFSSIYNTLLTLEDYLLIPEHIMLSPEYIYMSADYANIRLCYCPINVTDFNIAVRLFFDYILKNVDHDDEKAVYLAYSMHSEASKTDFNIDRLYMQLSSIPQLSSKEIDDSLVMPSYNHVHSHNHTDALTTLNNLSNISNTLKSTGNNSTDKLSSFIKAKAVALAAFIVISLITSICLYSNDIFPFSFFIILAATIIAIGCYNSYHLYRQYTPLKSVNSQTDIKKSLICHNDSSTVVLAAYSDDNTHKLIYTGTGNESDIAITHYPFVIGKTDACSAKLNNSAISRLHAKLSLQFIDDINEDIFIEDLNSTNGTSLNNNPLTPYERYPITSGDYITFGHLTYIFR